jgi:lysozyme
MQPTSRPKQSQETVRRLMSNVESPVVLLAVRGYYKKLGPNKTKNDINVYDDAMFVSSANGYLTFNANTDPSVTRHRVASLKEGVWHYRLGIHNITKAKKYQYPALIQAAPVTVRRHNAGEDTGWFGINIHRGGRTTTSSLGCLTIPPTQWLEFYNVVKGEMNRAKISRIPLVLVDNPWW